MNNSIRRVEISDLAYGGDGVARAADGRVVFVPFTLPGEIVEVDIVDQRKTFLRGRLRAIHQASAKRVTPGCPLFGRCGGCCYQHVDYPEQIVLKRKQLLDTLKRLGGFERLPEVATTIASPLAYAYRNKLTLDPFLDPSGTPDYGFFCHDEDAFTTIEACPLAAPEINRLLPEARKRALACANVAEVAAGRGQRLVLRKPSDGHAQFYLGRPHRRMDWLTEEACGLRLRVPLPSFWQVNPAVGDALTRQVAQWAAESGCSNVVDAYAGAGVFSLAVGKNFRRGSLIEIDRDALEAAKWNHRHAGVEGREFIAGRSERALPRLLEKLGDRAAETLAILDPPRSGCAKELPPALARHPVKTILYVSCNPATLARDLKTLCHQGPYRLARLALADMFPQTAHFEALAWLEKPPANDIVGLDTSQSEI